MAEQKKKITPPQRQKNTKKVKRKRRKKVSGSAVLAFLIVFFAFYLVFTLAIAGFLFYSFNSTSENPDYYSLTVLYDDNELYELDADEANNEYGLYIPFSSLSKISSFGLAGDGDDITLFLIGTDNRIKCTKNSALIEINDNPIRISSPILFDDEEKEYLIPVSLLDNYINGIDVSYDNEEMICTVASDIGKSDISLKLLLPEDIEAPYFPDSYKYYGAKDESSETESDEPESNQTEE